MSVDLTPLGVPLAPSSPHRAGGRLDWRERRRLASQDRRMAHLAELHGIRNLLTAAATLVSSGWVQHGWFSTAGPSGQRHVVTAHTMGAMSDEPISGACLVGAIVHAGGGPAAVHTQLVQRTLDLTWHTLYEDARQPVRWCPPPPLRMAHVRDLTRWNDGPERTSAQVSDLLHGSIGTANVETARLRVG